MAALCWSAGAAVAEDAAPDAGAVSGTDAATATEDPSPATPTAAEPQNMETRYAKGRALYQAGQFEEARAEFAAALQLRPLPAVTVVPAVDTASTPPTPVAPAMTDHVRELYATGRIFYAAGRFEEARTAFAEALRLQRGDASAAVPEAGGVVAVQVDIEPSVPEGLQTSTSLQQTRKERQQALHQLTGARQHLEQWRGEIRRLRAQVRGLPVSHRQRPKMLARLTQVEQAFVGRQAECKRLAGEIETLTGREAVLWYNWGVEADLQGHGGDAIARYREATALDPRHTNAQYNLATAFLKRRQIRQAEQVYQQLLAVDPQDADAHYNLGLIAEEYRQAPREALAHYRTYLQLAPPAAPERGLVQGWVSVIEDNQREGRVE